MKPISAPQRTQFYFFSICVVENCIATHTVSSIVSLNSITFQRDVPVYFYLYISSTEHVSQLLPIWNFLRPNFKIVRNNGLETILPSHQDVTAMANSEKIQEIGSSMSE